MYQFALLDPRNTDAARATNDAIFAAAPTRCRDCGTVTATDPCTLDSHAWEPQVIGIEVTVPTLARRCWNNIDPQHADGRTDVAAIDIALNCALPPDGATLATVRADLDSIGAMAVLELRRAGRLTLDQSIPGEQYWELDGSADRASELLVRVEAVSDSDRFARGPWPGPRPLPSAEDRWPADQAGASDTRELAAIASLVADPAHSVESRVRAMVDWLCTGDCSYLPLLPYEERVER